MSGLSRRLFSQFGKHSSSLDLTSTPTLVFKDLEVANFQVPEKEKLERDTQRDNGSFLTSLVGSLESGDLDFSVEQILNGLSGNTGAAITASAATDCADVLDVLCGSVTNPSGAAVTVSAGGGGLSTLTVSATSVATNCGVLVQLTDGSFIARHVISGGGTTTLTLDRAIAGAVQTGATLIRSAYWYVDTSAHEHVHGYWRFEEADHLRADFLGCAAKGSISVDARGYARLKTDWRANNSSPLASPLAPTYSAPTKGRAVVGFGGILNLGADALLFRDVMVDLGGDVVERVSHTGPNGRHGFTVQRKRVKISFKLFGGTNGTSFGELDPTSGQGANDLGGNVDSSGASHQTFDIGLQLGGAAQGTCYVRLPAAQFTKRKRISIDGIAGWDCEVISTAPSSTPNRAAYIHLF